MAVDLEAARRRSGGTGLPLIGAGWDVVAAVLGPAVVVAVHLDGRAHLLNLPDLFFTPWHGLLYGALTALVGWLLVMGRAHGARRGESLRMPAGYGLALVGGVLFFVGGGADLLWHTVFGIEFGIDALLSPSHLWLFVAGALLLSGPVRAALAHRATGTPATGAGLAATLVAVTSLAGLAAFALGYLSAYFTDAPTRSLPHFPEGTPEHAAVEIPASWGLASYLVTSLVVAVPLAWLVLRWRLPFGTVTGYAASLALLAVTMMDFHRLYAVAGTALAGMPHGVTEGIAGEVVRPPLSRDGVNRQPWADGQRACPPRCAGQRFQSITAVVAPASASVSATAKRVGSATQPMCPPGSSRTSRPSRPARASVTRWVG
jgi:hypothetical protein